MRALVLLTLMAAGASAAAPPAAAPGARNAPIALPSGRVCRDAFKVIPADTPAPPRARRLDELLPADTFFAVVNEVEGCLEPVVVRYGRPALQSADPPAPRRPRARVYR